MTGSIPHLAFDSAALPEDRQFAAWAGAVAAYPIEQIESGAFPVRAESWQIDRILLTRSTVPPVRMRRDAALIRQEGSDLYAVQLMLDGRWTGLLGTIPVSVEPGDAILIDRLAPMESESETTRSIILLIPRAFLDEAVQPFAMHGLTVTDTALGRIFAELLRALPEELSSVPATQAPSLAQAIRDMLAAALNQSRRSLDQPKALPLFGRAKRHIEAHLGDEISAASLASALRTSRSTLSRLFAATGGVESYMRRRRLQRAHRKLRRAQDVRTVAELAYALGFKSPSHFGRLFRSEYGYSPGALRAGLTVPDAAGHRPAEPAIRTFLRWQHEQI